jgi:hypothetical protein
MPGYLLLEQTTLAPFDPGSPPPQTDAQGNRFFAVNFNLTNV